jgi:small subunit ribosomal protein S1
VKVKILEIDSERRRLSLSVKRVEGQVLEPKILPPEELAATADDGDAGAGDLDDLPELGLSEDVFADAATTPEADAGVQTEVADEPAEAEAVADEPEAEVAAEPEAEAAVEPEVEAEPEVDAESAAEPEAEAVVEPEAETAEPEAEAAAEAAPEPEAAAEPDEPAAS